MAYVSPTLKMLIDVVRKASNAIHRDFNEIERLQGNKSYLNFVAGAYDKIEQNLTFEFNKAKPDFPVSKKLLASKGKYFLITPIDGIENLSRGIGLFTVCASLLDENNVVLAAVVYNPVMDEMYFAEKGTGTYRDGFRNLERLRVSERKDFKGSILASNKDLPKTEATYRSFGCSSLDFAYLAAGKIDGVVCFDVEVGSLMAGLALVKEAGGYVHDIKQENIRSEDLKKVPFAKDVMAVNSGLGQKVFDLVKK